MEQEDHVHHLTCGFHCKMPRPEGYEEARARVAPTPITVAMVDEAIAAYPEIDTGSARNTSRRYALTLLRGKPVTSNTPSRDTEATRHFGSWAKAHAPQKLASARLLVGRVEPGGPEAEPHWRWVPTLADDGYDAWDLVREWTLVYRLAELRMKRGDGGWMCHGARLLERVRHYHNVVKKGLGEPNWRAARPSVQKRSRAAQPSNEPKKAACLGPQPTIPIASVVVPLGHAIAQAAALPSSALAAPEGPYRAPQPAERLLRTCALTVGLKRYLREKKKLALDDRSVFHAISDWAKNTEEGRKWIKDCGLSPDSFCVDHVIPQSLGGRSCIYNAHFMPCGTNSHLGNMTNAEKKRYVGEMQVAIATANARWAAKHAVDHSQFEKYGLQAAIGRAVDIDMDSDSWDS